MNSYYGAVLLTALLMWGLLMYAVRKRKKSQKNLVFKVVGLTTVIAVLLPTLLNHLTLIQTGLLMTLLAAFAGTLVPVAELLPVKALSSGTERLEEEATSPEKEEKEAATQDQPEEAVRLGPTWEDPPEGIIAAEMEAEIEAEVEVKEEVEPQAETESIPEKNAKDEVGEEPFDPELVAALKEAAAQGERPLVLPDTFSETMAEVMLMNGYLALKEAEEEEAIESFGMVCQRALVTDQRMMAYMELKRLMPEVGKMVDLIQLSDSLLEGNAELTSMQRSYIEKHTHYLKRLVSLLNAHGVPLEQPYSAMPDELKEMAMTYQEYNQNRSEVE